MIAMKVVNIPMYTTLRRTTVLFVLLFEYLMNRTVSALTIQLSIGIMICGAFVAGSRDLNFDAFAYLIVVIYNICTAMYLVLINRISAQEKEKDKLANTSGLAGISSGVEREGKLDKYDLMFYNNLICIPLLIIIIACTGEWSVVTSPTTNWNDVGFIICLLSSSLLAFVLNYTIFWNTAVNSALTQTVSGQAKDIVVVIVGYAMFDDAHVDPINILGVSIGFAGSLLYALSKIFPICNIEPILQRMGWIQPDKKHEGKLTNKTNTQNETRTSGEGKSEEEVELLVQQPSAVAHGPAAFLANNK